MGEDNTNRFKDFRKHTWEDFEMNQEDVVLLAVSGGIDSMVMLDLCVRNNINIAVAHVNHSTRSGESDQDELFVKKYCQERGITFHLRKLNRTECEGGNFHDLARNIRYQFFQDLLYEHKYKYIATAHHMDDLWESFIMNAARGSGIHGLRAISYRNGSVIRPLLRYKKEDILMYQKSFEILFREDSSNNSDKYLRNRIRHNITGSAVSTFPRFLDGILHTTTLLKEEYTLLQYLISSFLPKWVKHTPKYDIIELKEIASCPTPEQLLFYILREYDYNISDVRDILLSTLSGKHFYSASHEAVLDRRRLLVRKKKNRDRICLLINEIGTYTQNDIEIRIKDDNTDNPLALPKHFLDKGITIRHWEPGDRFTPKGMGGRSKKIKDFLTDNKISIFDKDYILVATVDDTILQVVGLRNSEKVKQSKENVLISQSIAKH